MYGFHEDLTPDFLEYKKTIKHVSENECRQLEHKISDREENP